MASKLNLGIKALLGVGLLLSVRFLPLKEIITNSVEWIQDQGEMGPVYYTIFLALWVIALLPCSILEMVPGFLFGFKTGFVCSVIGKDLGNLISLLIGRYLLKDTIQDHIIQNYPKLLAIEKAIEHEGFLVIVMIRVTYMPMLIKNYGLSVLNVSILKIFVASVVSGLPFAAGWTFIGASSQNLNEIFDGKHSLKDALPDNAEYLIPPLLIFLGFFFYAMRSFSAKFQQILKENSVEPGKKLD